jgi:hypothetical protein
LAFDEYTVIALDIVVDAVFLKSHDVHFEKKLYLISDRTLALGPTVGTSAAKLNILL